MRHSVVLTCVLAVVLGGCARGGDAPKPTQTIEPKYTASSSSPDGPEESSGGCRLLTAEERRSLAGEKLDVVAPTQAADNTLTCRWVKSLATPVPTAVKVQATKARHWAVTLPRLIDGVIASGKGDSKLRKRLLAAKKKAVEDADQIGDDEACRMFSLFVEANGGEKGATWIVVFPPNKMAQFTATAQSCIRGVHTLLSYDENGLRPSRPLGEAVLRLAKAANKRAAKIL